MAEKNKLFKKKIPISKALAMWGKAERKWKDGKINLYDKFKEFEVIPVGHEGSRFAHDSIRLEGSYDFIVSILVMLLPLHEYVEESKCLDFELFMFEINEDEITPMADYSRSEKFCCYLRLKEKRTDLFDQLSEG